MKNKEKILVIGLDGATFDLIGPWIKKGILPNLAQLMKIGVSGELKSTVPPITCPAWNSFMTGKNPGKLGVYDFLVRKQDSYRLQAIDPRLFNRESIWDILSNRGKTVGIINVPATFPPHEVNGFMISGMLTPSEKVSFTYPKELKYKINNVTNGYRLDLDHWDFDNEERLIEGIYEIEEKRRKATEFLMDTFDCQFFMVVFCGSDRIQHFMWRHMDPKHPLHEEKSRKYKDAIKNLWQRLDQTIGELVEKAGKETTIIVLSDHGFGTQDKTFYINDWLLEKGYLNIKKGKFISYRKRIKLLLSLKRILELLGIYKTIRKHVAKGRKIYADIDWPHTIAFSLPHTSMFQQIYINVKGRDPEGCVSPEEYEKIRTEIIGLLKELKDPITNKKLKVKIHKPEDIYSGSYINQAPDIIYSINDLRCLSDPGLGHDYTFARTSINKKQNATHRVNGIFIAKGPHIEKGKVIRGAQIIDIAPTILHIMDLPIPKDMDGKVLKAIFNRNSRLYKKKIEYQDPAEAVKQEYVWSKEDEEQIRERLKGLGYLG